MKVLNQIQKRMKHLPVKCCSSYHSGCLILAAGSETQSYISSSSAMPSKRQETQGDTCLTLYRLKTYLNFPKEPVLSVETVFALKRRGWEDRNVPQKTISLKEVEIRKRNVTFPLVQHHIYRETKFSTIVSDTAIKFPCNILVLCQFLCGDLVIVSPYTKDCSKFRSNLKSKGNSVQEDEGILLASVICAQRAEDHSWYLLPLVFLETFFALMRFSTSLNQSRIYPIKTSLKYVFFQSE